MGRRRQSWFCGSARDAIARTWRGESLYNTCSGASSTDRPPPGATDVVFISHPISGMHIASLLILTAAGAATRLTNSRRLAAAATDSVLINKQPARRSNGKF